MATTAQSAQSKTGTTEQLIQFLVDTNYSHLSEAARERAKELVLDFARAALGGGTSPLGKIVLDRIKGVGARGEASVIGGKFRTATAYAAYANAVLDHAPEPRLCLERCSVPLSLPPLTLEHGRARHWRTLHKR